MKKVNAIFCAKAVLWGKVYKNDESTYLYKLSGKIIDKYAKIWYIL